MTFLSERIMNGSDWRAFERMPARVLTQLGWKSIQIIGESGDHGGDTLAVDPFGRSWIIQAKSVSGDRLVGPAAIQEALNAQAVYGADAIAVATNGDFTRSAVMRKDELVADGYNVHLWNSAWFKEVFDRLPDLSMAQKTPKSYQQFVVDKLIDAYQSDKGRALFVLATGLGKTVTAATAVNRFWQLGARRMLVLCHQQDLALQLEQSFWSQLDKSIPTSCFYEGSVPSVDVGVAFGLYQTLKGWIPGIDPSTYDVVIVDEAHHALSGGYSSCLRYFKPKILIGMTATPWRGDGRPLEDMFGEALCSISLVDGMRMGYLATVDYHVFCDNIDWGAVPSLSQKKFSIRDLNKRLFLPQRDSAIVEKIKEFATSIERPRIAVFSPSIEHSHLFAETLTSEGFLCRPLSGVDKVERRANLLAFSSGKIDAVTAVDVMNEGIDVPDVNIMVFLRPTQSRRIFLQQLGRGLRLSSTKQSALVLDFVSDIKRIAYAIEIDNEAKEKGIETLNLGSKIVSFDNKSMGAFVAAWLEDVGSDDFDDSTELLFPGLG